MNPIIREWSLKVVAGTITVTGKVFGHDEYATGAFFQTPPIQVIDLKAGTVSTASKTYTVEGGPK